MKFDIPWPTQQKTDNEKKEKDRYISDKNYNKINVNMICFQWMIIGGEVYIIILLKIIYCSLGWQTSKS